MPSLVSADRLRLFLSRLGERLWVKPLVVCLLSIAAAFLAKFADRTRLADVAPEVPLESVDALLSIMATSMLVIATFAVSSMVAAYASASRSATPRAFSLVVADDVSQNALSTFIGAFIFSIVAITAIKNNYFGTAGVFTLFVMTVTTFGVVIFTFVRWVDSIARLGRLGSTIEKVERVAADALKRRRDAPTLHAAPHRGSDRSGYPVHGSAVGYVQHVDVAELQKRAEQIDGRIEVAVHPGTFVTPERALALLVTQAGEPEPRDMERIAGAFKLGNERRFDDDPRFGLVVLSEIAGRALSPAVNDPGTAIRIIGSLVRLLSTWRPAATGDPDDAPKFDRVGIPRIDVHDLFDDAFTAVARDGAGSVEVAVRLQKGLRSLARTGDEQTRVAAIRHALIALARAERSLDLPEDLERVRNAAAFATDGD